MSLKQLIQKGNKLLPWVGLGIGIDSYLISKGERDARLNFATSKFNRISEQLKTNQDILVKQQENQNKIGGLSSEAMDQINSITHEGNIIKEIKTQLLNTEITKEQKENLMKQMDPHLFNQTQSIEKANKNIEQINDIIVNAKESNFFSFFNELLVSYRKYLYTLTLEQIGAIIHLFAIIIIFSCLITIISILYGEFLIQKFQIEDKYPRLARFIQLRRKIKKYSLLINFSSIFIVLFILVWFNLYIFFS